MDETSVGSEADLHERDFDRWTELQAAHLRQGRPDLLDVPNLIEEIEALGKSQLFALRSSYTLIAMHLLKQMRQPAKAPAGWENTINRERGNVADLLDEYPGLKPKRAEAFAKAYRRARTDAAFETGMPLSAFPTDPPFTPAQAEAKAWWPPGFPRSAARQP